VGGKADAARRPLVGYGCLEIGIGLFAFCFASIYAGADTLYTALGVQVLDQYLLLLILKTAMSIGLLIVPTVLMGGTLPLLASWLERAVSDPGRASARFYAVNSLGAVIGAWLSGFILVRQLGMVSSLQAAAIVNVLVGLIAVGIGRRQDLAVTTKPAPNPLSADRSSAEIRWPFILVALSGGLSMGLEVVASRGMALVFGSSLQAFAIALMGFILGIGCAGATVSSPRAARWSRDTACAMALLGAGAALATLMSGVEFWVDIYRHAKVHLEPSPKGYLYYELFTGLAAIAALGTPAALIGAVLPLCIKNDQTPGSLGKHVGRLIAWNTVGAVVGVLVTGFILMPRIGLRGALGASSVILCLASVVTLWRAGSPRLALLPSTAAAAFLGLALFGGEGWRLVISSGVFRERVRQVDTRYMKWRHDHIRLLYYEDGADATVSVETGDGSTEFGILADDDPALRINGKVDATAMGDFPTQQMIAQLPMLARPQSKEVFVLGFGSGITAGALLGHPVDRVTIAENCVPVLRAGQCFTKWNRGVLTDRRVRILEEDARTVLKLGGEKYDIIINEPSNPWTVGVGSVFSREFYEIAANGLKDDGIIAQWFHVYENNDALVAMILRTFSSVFPYMEIWDPRAGDVVMLGSKHPWKSDPSVYAKIFEREIPRADFKALGLLTPESVWARQIASQRTASLIPGPGPLQSDAFPILEYDAPAAFFIGASSRLLFKFDERTWQSDLAPDDKFSALRKLPDEQIRSVFGKYDSVNLDLQKLLFWRVRLPEHPVDPAPMSGKHPLPSLFRPAYPPPSFVAPPANADPAIRDLAQAEIFLDLNSTNKPQGIALVAAVLERQMKEHSPSIAPADTTYSAAQAVRVAFRLGRKDDAVRLLTLAATLDPTSYDLAYLGRFLTREGWISPTSPP